MSEGAIDRMLLVIALISGAAIGLYIGSEVAKRELGREAFERGYMVECLGKTGHYWECGDE